MIQEARMMKIEKLAEGHVRDKTEKKVDTKDAH